METEPTALPVAMEEPPTLNLKPTNESSQPRMTKAEKAQAKRQNLLDRTSLPLLSFSLSSLILPHST